MGETEKGRERERARTKCIIYVGKNRHANELIISVEDYIYGKKAHAPKKISHKLRRSAFRLNFESFFSFSLFPAFYLSVVCMY